MSAADTSTYVPGLVAVQRRIVLMQNKDDIVFSFEGPPERLPQILDQIRRAADREKAIAELPEKEQALHVAYSMPAQMDEEIDRLRKERSAQEAGFHARHQVSGRGRRGEGYTTSESERNTLDQFDKQIENALVSKNRFVADLPIIEWEVERRKAIRDGQPEPPKPEKLVERTVGEVLHRAA